MYDNKPLDQDDLPFKVRVKSQKGPLRSHLPKLPHPLIDEKTSSDKPCDLSKDIQQLQAGLYPFMPLKLGYLL